jgi:molybdopterin biosynthesis enzyme
MDGYAMKTSELVNSRTIYDTLDSVQKENYQLDFVIVGKVYAGDDDDGAVIINEILSKELSNDSYRTAVYITTGAVLPDGYDAVIPLEDTDLQSNTSDDKNNENSNLLHHQESNMMHILPSKVEYILQSIKPYTWVRPIGCDIPPGTIVLSKGEVIQPVHIALLLQIGIQLENVLLYRLPRIGVLSTGNELYDASSSSVSSIHGKIPDINRPLLLSQLASYGNCIPIDLGIVTDNDDESIATRLNNILWTSDYILTTNAEDNVDDDSIDVLISTGGISMGEKDIMEQVFVNGMGGTVHFGRLDMKPGKPTTFITIDRDVTAPTTTPVNETEDELLQFRHRKLIFALPGNPVSASVCTELLIRPCLDLLHHGITIEPPSSSSTSNNDCVTLESFVDYGVRNACVHDEIMATITSDIALDQERPEYRRVILNRKLVASNTGMSGSASTICQQYLYTASDTGVQRSSRVLSLRGAEGLMILPRGGPLGCGYDVARKGMEFPVLLYKSSSSNRFEDSIHQSLCKSVTTENNRLRQKLKLGVIIVCNDNADLGADVNDGFFQAISDTLVTSLGGKSSASVIQQAVVRLNKVFPNTLSTTINSPTLNEVNVMFVIVPTTDSHTTTAGGDLGGEGGIAFKAGLEVAHVLSSITSKNAHAMALHVRKAAAMQDPVAALFENVVGTVRDNSCVLISCSNRGLEGAACAIKGHIVHLLSAIL